jgi:hypothetical protein
MKLHDIMSEMPISVSDIIRKNTDNFNFMTKYTLEFMNCYNQTKSNKIENSNKK